MCMVLVGRSLSPQCEYDKGWSWYEEIPKSSTRYDNAVLSVDVCVYVLCRMDQNRRAIYGTAVVYGMAVVV